MEKLSIQKKYVFMNFKYSLRIIWPGSTVDSGSDCKGGFLSKWGSDMDRGGCWLTRKQVSNVGM